MELNAEHRVTLDKFQLRDYQKEIWWAIETAKKRKLLVVMPRRAGKDITLWNLAIRQCLQRVCLVFYCLQTYGQARKAIWDAIAIDGTKFLDYIPKELIERVNSSEMKIVFKNGSILQCIGADSYNTALVGTNPYAIIFSEYSRYADGSKAYEFARPILAANGGWFVAASTPFGKNHFFQLFKVAQELPDWHVIYKKTSEIKHIPEEVLAQEKAQMDPGLYEQEYEVSFDRGIEGSYYGKYLERLRQANQIGPVPWENGLLVYTAWDIGVNDATSIVFFQVVGDGTVIRIIDYYTNNNVGIDHYAKILQDKPYRYGKHFAPFDIKVREWGGGAVTRYERARQLDVKFEVLDQISLHDGIENVWSSFNKFWIDEGNCRSLLDSLENYRREWDEAKQMYKGSPVRSWANHGADCVRYMCQAIHKTKKGLSPEEFERKKAEALYSNRSKLPGIFSEDPRYKPYY